MKGFSGSPGAVHSSTWSLMRRLLRDCVRPYGWTIVLAVFCMALMAGATALSAWLMKPVVNDIFIGQRHDVLWLVAGAVLVTFVIKGLANYGQSTLISKVGLKIIADSQNSLFAHLASLDLAFFQSQPSGGLISRFTNDINSMRAAVSNALTGLGKDFLSVIGLVAVMFVQDWRLALVTFFIFPLAVLPIVRIGRRMRRVTANTQQEFGLFTALLGQTIQGIRIVKSYGMEAHERARTAAIVERIFSLTFKAARIRAIASPIMETLGGAAVALVIVYGGTRVIEQQIDAGSFFSFITALLLAYEPMKRLANLNASLQEGLAGAQRMFDLLDHQSAIAERPGALPLRLSEGEVRFETVSFSYGEGAPALNGVSLVVPAGKTVALVGPSGAGKSTILNLVPRFFDVQEGRVLIDGQDVRSVSLASIYANIALVSQEVTLFDDTVRANIAYGRWGASDEEIFAAARQAAAHDFIMELPNGYGTLVGEQGIKLSGGQRQRLAIARAILKNAPLLLLDEATSALDTESERHVQAALDSLMQGRTTLVIAHRLSTVVAADLIYVVDGGVIAEFGNHGELIRRNSKYARLYAMQFAGHGTAVAVG